MNPAGRELLGDQAIGRTASDLGFRHEENGSSTQVPLELEGPRGTGLVAVRSQPMVTGTQYTLRDVTDQVATQQHERVVETRTLQAQKLEALGRLAGGVAHNFNNLLTAMLANLHILRDLGVDPEQEELIDPIEKAALAAARVTNQLLAFGRPNTGVAASVELFEVMTSMAYLLRRTLGDGIELEVQAVAPLHIQAVPAEVEQIVVNLVVNAADGMPEGGKVRMTATIEGEQIRLSVTKEGESLPTCSTPSSPHSFRPKA